MSRKGKKRGTRSSVVNKEVSPARSSSSGWIPPATGLKIIVATSLLLAMFVGGNVYQQTGDGEAAARLAFIAGASIWLIFGLVLIMTRIIRSRV